MKILIDTNILIFILFDKSKLNKRELSLLIDPENDIFISSISFLEISIKYALGKIKLTKITPDQLPKHIINAGFQIEEIDHNSLASLHQLPNQTHKDPFDRLIIWESINKKYHLLTKDKSFKLYKPNGLKLA